MRAIVVARAERWTDEGGEEREEGVLMAFQANPGDFWCCVAPALLSTVSPPYVIDTCQIPLSTSTVTDTVAPSRSSVKSAVPTRC